MQTNDKYKVKKMKKEAMIEAIENAKQLHLHQMIKIESEIAGKKVDNPTALGKMECECGVWFYENEKEMKEILGLQFFDRLDKNHEQWHSSYASIYKMFFQDEKKGLFARLLGDSESENMKMDRAKLYYSELQKDTEELIKSADAAIRRVSALKETKFHE